MLDGEKVDQESSAGLRRGGSLPMVGRYKRQEKLVSGAARVPEWGASGRGLTRSGPRNNEDENQPGKGSVPVPCPLSDLSILGVDECGRGDEKGRAEKDSTTLGVGFTGHGREG